jgi:hypothetical protein
VTTWSDVLGSGPAWWFEVPSALPEAEVVAHRIRRGGHTKAVALVGYDDDAEASAIARRLPYGYRGEGIEENVFCRVGPATGQVLEFEDDAWPGEDRTYVSDDVDAAFSLVLRFAAEYGVTGAAVLVTGGPEFLAAIRRRLTRDDLSGAEDG